MQSPPPKRSVPEALSSQIKIHHDLLDASIGCFERSGFQGKLTCRFCRRVGGSWRSLAAQ